VASFFIIPGERIVFHLRLQLMQRAVLLEFWTVNIFTRLPLKLASNSQSSLYGYASIVKDKMLSYRKETALQGAL